RVRRADDDGSSKGRGAGKAPDGELKSARLGLEGQIHGLGLERGARRRREALRVRRRQLELEPRRILVVRRVEATGRDAVPGLNGVKMAVDAVRAVVHEERPRKARGGQRTVLRVGSRA